MSLVVPVLRLFFVFLNIWDSFKVLKLPRPSARNGGKPSVRAMTQRKRDMKGVMTIWMVWCCYTTYEQTLDSAVGIFIPFYDELKSLILIFFIITRARGAEPIYLHVMRPMIKPYSTTIDALLVTAHSIGDFIMILLAWPKHSFMSWYHRWTSSRPEEGDDIQSLSSSEVLFQGARPDSDGSQQSRFRSRSRTIREDDSTAAEITARLNALQPSESDPADTFGGHQIWYPPPPAYDEQDESDIDRLPQFNVASRLDVPQLSVHFGSALGPPAPLDSGFVDEWRKYPDFPSAYPPTPIVAPKSFRIIAPVPKRPSDVINFANISEEDESSDSQVEESGLEKIDGSLQKREEMVNSDKEKEDSDRHSSDNDSIAGVQIVVEEGSSDEDEHEHEGMNTTLKTPRALRHGKGGEDADVGMDMDMDISDIEQDSFDFKTPKPLRTKPVLLKPRPQSIVSVPSTSSWQSRSTALSTNDGGSSLRTRTGSESESMTSVSDSSQALVAAGRKRPFPRTHDSQSTVKLRPTAQTMSRSSSSGDAIAVTRPGAIRTRARRLVKTDDEAYEGEGDTDRASDESFVPKKRKLVGPVGVSRIPRKDASSQLPSAVPSQKAAQPKDAVPPAARRNARMGVPKDSLSTRTGTGKARSGTTGSRR